MVNSKKNNILMLLMNESIGGTATYLLTLMGHMDPDKFDFLVVCNNPAFCDLAISKGFKAVRLEKAGRGRYFKSIRHLCTLVRDNRIDMINIHDGGAVSLIGRMAAYVCGIPSVSTVHIYAGDWGTRSKFSAAKEKFMEAITQPLTKKIIAVSHARKKELVAKGIADTKITVIQNGINVSLFTRTSSGGTFRKELGVASSTPLIGVIAHLGKEKGHACLLEAAKSVISEHPDIKFVIVGEGYLKAPLQRQAQNSSIAGHVVFTGFRTDIPDILEAIDIFVLPSLNEGLPMVILEAMAASRPVIASRIGGIPEAVIHGETGYLVPPGDADKLADAVCRLIRSPQTAQNYGRAGFRRVNDHFSAERMAEETGRLYESIL